MPCFILSAWLRLESVKGRRVRQIEQFRSRLPQRAGVAETLYLPSRFRINQERVNYAERSHPIGT